MATLAVLMMDGESADSLMRATRDIKAWRALKKGDLMTGSTIVSYLERLTPAFQMAKAMIIGEASAHAKIAEALLARGTLKPRDLREILGPSAYEQTSPATW